MTKNSLVEAVSRDVVDVQLELLAQDPGASLAVESAMSASVIVVTLAGTDSTRLWYRVAVTARISSSGKRLGLDAGYWLGPALRRNHCQKYPQGQSQPNLSAFRYHALTHQEQMSGHKKSQTGYTSPGFPDFIPRVNGQPLSAEEPARGC